MDQLPVNQTLLPLLASLLNMVLAEQKKGGRIGLKNVRLEPTRIILDLELARVTSFMDGIYPLELHLEECHPDRTVCSLNWGSQKGITKLVGLGAKLIPRSMINEALNRYFGEGIRVEGDFVYFEHRPLLKKALGRE